MVHSLEIALAALLHDIGKFSQRAYRGKDGLGSQSRGMTQMLCPTGKHGAPTHLHVLYTNEFLENIPYLPEGFDRSRVANLAAYHHRPDDPEQEMIAWADRLSSGMERLASADGASISSGHFRKTRLLSPLSTIRIPEAAPSPSLPLALEVLSPDSGFPIPPAEASDLTEEYQRLWQQFVSVWDQNRCPDPVGFVNRAISVLERFTWCIPSATNAVPDISLFDHMKATAAIAVCLHAADEDSSEPFLLVGGDLTGIQKYIFDVHQGSGGLARRLRARSFQVAAFAESVSLTLLTRLGLPLSQRILFAGGKFHLLLPNNQNTRQHMEDVQAKASKWLYQRSAGEINFVLTSIALNKTDLRDFSQCVTKLNSHLHQARHRSGETMLIDGDVWREDAFKLPALDFEAGDGVCQACEKQIGQTSVVFESTRVLCSNCQAEEKLGQRLPQARRVAFYNDRSARHQTPLGSFDLLGDTERANGSVQLLVDMDGVSDGNDSAPLVAAHKCRHIPVDPATGAAVMFEEIAARSTGRPALGVLKMDVDNLGYVFSVGLRTSTSDASTTNEQATEGRDRTSVSRVAAVSRMLELFFSGHLESLIRDSFPDVYMIYSGGDDLAAVGPWNQVFDLARRIRQDFRTFTGRNDSWTLSAGIAVVHAHLPVLTAIEEADLLLEASKTAAGEGVIPWPFAETTSGAVKKDRITVFGVSIPWREFPNMFNDARRVDAWVREGVLNSAKLHRLLHYAELSEQFQRTRDTRYLQYAPLLVRDLRRNWPEKTPAEREAREWAASLALPESAELKGVRFICQYVLTANREKD